MATFGPYLLAIIIFTVGIVFAAVNKKRKICDTTTFIALLLAPIIVLGVATGAIQEFSAPGGWSAKFARVARADVKQLALRAAEIASPVVKEQQLLSPAEIRREAARHLLKNEALFLALDPKKDFYTPPLTIHYIETLVAIDPDLPVVIRNTNGTFFAMADAIKFWALMNDESHLIDGKSQGQLLIDTLIANKMEGLPLKLFPDIVTIALKEDTANAEALQLMLNNHLRSMVIVDKDNKTTHISKRDLIVGHLVAQLTN